MCMPKYEGHGNMWSTAQHYFAVDWSQQLSWVLPQVQELEGDMKPLKDGLQSLTSQKDALLAEKTALKNEVNMAN